MSCEEDLNSPNSDKSKKGNFTKFKPDFIRSGSRDNIRKIVEKEGKTARNLVTWSVPTTENASNEVRGRSRTKNFEPAQNNSNKQHKPNQKKEYKRNTLFVKAINSEREDIIRRHNNVNDLKTTTGNTSVADNNNKKDTAETNNNNNFAADGKSLEKSQKQTEDDGSDEKSRETKSAAYKERVRQAIEKSSSSRPRSNSSTASSSQRNLRARYWSYLLDNFHRAVDEIYGTCENDKSVVECQEIIMMIDVCRRDFTQLIQRLELFSQLESSDTRPQALAWEVRKQMSPGKSSPSLRRSPSPAAIKFLNFNATTSSWADRVRGIQQLEKEAAQQQQPITVQTLMADSQTKKCFPSPVLENEEKGEQRDYHEETQEGWEVVRKGRSRSKTSSIVSSASSSQTVLPKEPSQITPKESTENIMTALNEENDELFDDGQFYDDTAAVLQPYNMTDDYLNNEIEQEQEKALASVIAEEETLTKELEEEALKADDDNDDDISSDRDYATTDDGRDTPKDFSEDLPIDCSISSPSFEAERGITWEDMCAQYEQESNEFSWADMMERTTENVRTPGRALEMHQKLSSPSRKQSRSDYVKRSEEKMARAERRRLRILVDKCERLRDLSEKVRKVRNLKNQLIEEKEHTMLEQMKRAELNRSIALQEKIRKAQEEEAKVNEIAFINSLEAQNKKIEVEEKHQISEARLQELIEERQKRRGDKLAKEEAAQERRRALEEERKARLHVINEKRGFQAEKWRKERVEREKQREEIARERQKDREMKVAARNEALQQASEELQKRIEQKHIDSTRRHEQRIEDIKERAASSSRHSIVEDAPSAIPYIKMKKCTLCDMEICSDVYLVSHLKGKLHKNAVREVNKKISDAEMEAFSAKYINEAEVKDKTDEKEIVEHNKAMKKRARKLKSRMSAKGKEFEANYSQNTKGLESQKRGRFQKAIKEINKLLQGHSNGPWPKNKVATLDKTLSEILRSLDGNNSNDEKVFCQLGGLAVLSRVLQLWDLSSVEKFQKSMIVPPKIIRHASEAIRRACEKCTENSDYMLLANKLSILVDIITFRLQLIVVIKQQAAEGGETLLSVFEQDETLNATILECLTACLSAHLPRWPVTKTVTDTHQRLQDFISYSICQSVLEKLCSVYEDVQYTIEGERTTRAVESIISFFRPFVMANVRLDQIFSAKKDDNLLLPQIIEKTNALGLVGFMYSLLHQGGNVTRVSPSPLPLSQTSLNLLTTSFRSLNTLALYDVTAYQKTLSREGISLQYRSIVSYLLRKDGSESNFDYRSSRRRLTMTDTSSQARKTSNVSKVKTKMVNLSSTSMFCSSHTSTTKYKYTSNEKCDDLLHEVILSLGYFALLNQDNQIFLQIGRAPSLLQQLCTLPFSYFSNNRLKTILFPTLISLCFKNMENTRVISHDVSPTLLAIFLKEKLDENKTEKSVIIGDMEGRSKLDLRFPVASWEEAREYFTEQTDA